MMPSTGFGFVQPRPWLDIYYGELPRTFQSLALVAKKEEEDVSKEDRGRTEKQDGGEVVEEHSPCATLPEAVLNAVFKWLDPAGLSRCAMVCRSWRSLAYQPSHWKRVCQQTWPKHSLNENLNILLTRKYSSWRHMFLERPRMRTDGVYILMQNPGKTYFRYFRFYSDGTCVALVTPETPDKALRRLRREYHPTASDVGKLIPSVGTFELEERDCTVFLVLPTYQPKYPNMKKQTMHYRLDLQETKEGARNRLKVVGQAGVFTEFGPPAVIHLYSLLKFSQPFEFIPFTNFKSRCVQRFGQGNEYGRQAKKMKVWSPYEGKHHAATMSFLPHPSDHELVNKNLRFSRLFPDASVSFASCFFPLCPPTYHHAPVFVPSSGSWTNFNEGKSTTISNRARAPQPKRSKPAGMGEGKGEHPHDNPKSPRFVSVLRL